MKINLISTICFKGGERLSKYQPSNYYSEGDKIMFNKIVRKSEKGQDLAEYALLLGLLALVVIIAVTVLGTNLNQLFSELASAVGTWF
jgi:pilus assembly protein Flp/PilA